MNSSCLMSLRSLTWLLFAFLLCIGNVSAQKQIYPPEKELWDADSLGNHRALVQVNKKVKSVTVAIEWRNRNVKPEQTVYVMDPENQTVSNVVLWEMGPERGVVTFDTSEKTGVFQLYYLPYRLEGRANYPTVNYHHQEHKVRPATKQFKISKLKVATVIGLESVDTFNGNDPMEVIATKNEVHRLKASHPQKTYLVFPEKRIRPIKMKSFLPKVWADTDIASDFSDETMKGENFTFQLGVWAFNQDLEDVGVSFSNLKDAKGNEINATDITCFNKEGIDYTGTDFLKTINVGKGKVQALWFGVRVPEDIASGTYSGTVTISPKNAAPSIVTISLRVSDKTAMEHNIAEPWKQTRLNWINSTLAQQNSVIEPYLPLEVSDSTISLLGRKVTIGNTGFPNQIQSFFTEAMTSISTVSKDLLTAPFRFKLMGENGREIKLESNGTTFLKKEPGIVSWNAITDSPEIKMEVNGALEFDGFASFVVKVIAKRDINLQDIALHIPFHKESSKYILGLGLKGGQRPETLHWKWDVAHKNQDGVWLGGVNAGMQLSLRDEHYERPLNTNFYLQKPLTLPTSWGNENKGGINIVTDENTVMVNNYSGKRAMKKGDILYYNFTLLITPFHTLQTDAQWNERYFHSYKPIDSVIKSGSNVINIHHANELNPYINYPFIATKEMKEYVDEAHKKNLKVKIYNTVREVSNRLYELYPLRSLNNEVFSKGPGGGYSWLQEHLQDNYIAAWYVPTYKDAAIINSGMNRWHNYYVEGMNWLVQNIGIDGIYLDDVAFDRITMKRIKRVLTKEGHSGLIDLHSANQFNERDGFNNSANLYMEHFPYINRLWFGEYFDYEAGSPDFYLTEVSGIPFGLMGEMLQDGGNPWRGMIYGMTNRMPYQKQKPDQIWKVWDDFGIKGSEMIGYWVSDNPIKTNNEKVLATVYKKESKVLVAIASWAADDTKIKLNIDWKKLGIDPKTAKIKAQEVKSFQPSAVFNIGDEIPVKKNQGWLLIIE